MEKIMKTAKVSTKKITLVKAPTDEFKTPQIKVMLSVLAGMAKPGTAVLHTDMLKAIDDSKDFVSCQGARLVFGFYQARLIEAGLIKISN